ALRARVDPRGELVCAGRERNLVQRLLRGARRLERGRALRRSVDGLLLSRLLRGRLIRSGLPGDGLPGDGLLDGRLALRNRRRGHAGDLDRRPRVAGRVLRNSVLGVLAADEVEDDGRSAGVDDARTGGRRLGDYLVARIAVHGADDVPGET